MTEPLENIDPLALLYELRGVPDGCDFCQRKLPADQLEPEEAGDWVCHDCMWRWQINENAAILKDNAALRAELEQAVGILRSIQESHLRRGKTIVPKLIRAFLAAHKDKEAENAK